MNIGYSNLSKDRIACWRLLLEEFGPKYVHVRGKDNVVADALSRMDLGEPETMRTDSVTRKEKRKGRDVHGSATRKGQVCASAVSMLIRNEAYPLIKNKKQLAKKLISTKDLEEELFPLLPRVIQKEQQDDPQIKQLKEKHSEQFGTRELEDAQLVTFRDRIFLPTALRARVIAWYHEYLSHPGKTRMEATLKQTLYWPKMADDIHEYVKKCKKCQMCKGPQKEYGHLPPKEHGKIVPWQRVDLDMVGPFKIKTPSGEKELRALTMIDPATGWFEVKDVAAPDSENCMIAFDDTWLCRYPRPQFLGYDGGSEYKAMFNQLRMNYGLKGIQSSSYNPQSNGIVERVHQVLTNCLRTYELDGKELNERDPWGPFLAAAAFAIRSTYHTTLHASPGQLVFGRDMILPIQFKADWAVIQQLKQDETNKNNERENRKRIAHEYKVGDQILLKIPRRQRKHRKSREGPYAIEQVNSNGTIRIRRRAIAETVNIRRVIPFFE